MDPDSFKDYAKEMAEYITNYLENIRDRKVLPTVEPGYMKPLLPSEAPQTPEQWQDIMADVERIIMPGVTHWHSPKFHAYFPTAQSYPSILADMLSGAIACIGFTWIASPACTELEVIVLDWLGKMLNLPKEFLACSGGKGGGVIQGTASEATLVALLGAKAKKIQQVKEQHPDWTENEIISKLVAYCSCQAHSSVERAGLLGGVKFRQLEVDEKYKLRGDTFAEAIRKDREQGFIPFYAVATLGTTVNCAFDRLDEMGIVANREGIWLHVDAAYAGSSFICPEFRYLMKGIELADSFNFNPHKWMLVNFDCSAMWLKDPTYVINAFNVDPLYLKHDMQGSAPDYRHWQIPLGRRFRSLKLWFVLRLYGVENLQKFIRSHVAQAHEFEALVLSDPRFEIVGEVLMGLVCFRLKGSNELNEALLKRINGAGNIHLVPSKIKDTYFLRLAVCSRFSESKDIQYSWKEIKLRANEILEEQSLSK
ncbi:PREDICTED: aromatic-L-amino-acid decarboxylase-like [Trachymyrmex cornetzi]|uniref:aromatic-L-amino-acid decarboxylase-like n=1 Tax=Trachymyrmex cornetzi TaxID=471704 RepID=UPI00084EF5BE|nr:PREDICTED: aromatic-L-amino-acid decarboxylase-like [Trachymyrmex cornetzi]XP_018368359.1 PREDICTED: aromatic-L-amino-acid decarboxylase-like [Trachymyrmex cornetzi]XP_018368360.1 PREDICTED: aromatic-L-amino-acid decarboxylase-like [Trachymyrmex cornetzi]